METQFESSWYASLKVPIHVGQPIEWKPAAMRNSICEKSQVPIHVGQPIEWKHVCPGISS